MKWSKWLENWNMTSLKINVHFLEMEWSPQDADKNAAWELYIELLTRITTQRLDRIHGHEQAALDSVYSLFATTRQVLKNYSRECNEFAKIAIVILNQIIRPFTSKWHKLSLQGAFSDEIQQQNFREELEELQNILIIYTKMLAQMAGVEDLTSLEKVDQF